MSANPLGHLTVAQLEAAEDYLGVTLDRADEASRVRLAVLGAWATRLRSDPAATLEQVRELPFDEVQELAEKSANGGPLGEA